MTDDVPNEASGEGAAGQALTANLPAAWPEDWRGRFAGSNADDLRALNRYEAPEGIWKKVKNLEKKLQEKAPARPQHGASQEEVAAWRIQAGVPAEAEDYLASVEREGRVLGDADREIALSFASAMHAVHALPETFGAAVDWYFNHLQHRAAERFEQDLVFRAEADEELTEAWGPAKARNIAAIRSLFVDAPGGDNVDDERALVSRLLAGRTSDGRTIGDDSEITRWLSSLARQINPTMTIIGGSGGNPSARLAEIRKLRSENPDRYWGDKAMQAEELKLIAAEQRRGRGG